MAEEPIQPLGAEPQGTEPTLPNTPPVTEWRPPQPPASPGASESSTPIPTQPIPTQPIRPDAYAAAGQQPAPNYPIPGAPVGSQAWNYPPPTQNSYYPAPGYPPPPPGYTQVGQYPFNYGVQPPAPPQRRWPVLVLATVLVIGLAFAGFTFTNNVLGAIPSTQVSTPASPSLAPSQSGAGTRSNAVTAAEAKGVVLIEGTTAGGTAYGTGMVLTADGKVLTNYHVVAGTEKVAVTLATTGSTYLATVLGFDQAKDVALLQLANASGLDTVTIDADQVTVGDQVAAVGNANGGMKLVKAAGSVTDTGQSLTVNSDSPWGNTEDLSGLVATNAGAVPGDSGGPMFDAQNEVLGITTAGSTKDHASYAVPISTALAVVQQIETGQDAGTVRVGPAGFLGVKVTDSSQTGTGGPTVSSVVANSPADKAGMSVGSQITKIGNTTITATTNVAGVIRAVEPGQQVTIWWTTAKGKSRHATVTAGASPFN
jgi:S1-C subfamily serine protease